MVATGFGRYHAGETLGQYAAEARRYAEEALETVLERRDTLVRDAAAAYYTGVATVVDAVNNYAGNVAERLEIPFQPIADPDAIREHVTSLYRLDPTMMRAARHTGALMRLMSFPSNQGGSCCLKARPRLKA